MGMFFSIVPKAREVRKSHFIRKFTFHAPLFLSSEMICDGFSLVAVSSIEGKMWQELRHLEQNERFLVSQRKETLCMTMPDHDFSFGALLKTIRRRRHLTQQVLAEAIGVHRSTFVRWEQGDYLPESKTMMLELARHLHLDDQETRQLLEASLTTLTPHWSVPSPRNPYFTGREEILEALHAQLGANQAVALTQSSALHGLGGVGKTQIALEYAYRYALEYSAVFWIGAETEEQIISSLLRMAEVLGLPGREDKDQQRVIAAVQRWLSAHGQWLLVWDNVEDLALLDRFLPSTRSGVMLLTTRSQALGTLARGMDLRPLEQEEGMLFLLRRAKVLSPEAESQQMRRLAEQMPQQYAAAAELVVIMGGLPLALDQAGAYLEATQCGLQAYLEHFHAQRAALLTLRGDGARDHPASVSATFRLSMTATAQRHPAVRDMLRVCSLVQPDAIPEELFRQGAEHLGATLQAVCRDPLEWDQLVARACSYSLLFRQPEEQTLSIHRLVQAVLLDAMTEAERQRWQRQVIEALDAVFPEVRATTEYALWKQCERLLPHARLCLRHMGAVEAFSALASLAYKVALYLRDRGQPAEAEPLFERALHIWEQALGPEHPSVALALTGLGRLSRERGSYLEAEALFERALSIQEQHLGPSHPETAQTLQEMALLRQQQDNLGEAISLAQRARSIRSQALGEAHPKTVATRTLCAQLFQEQAVGAEPTQEHLRALLKTRGWSLHLKKRHDKSYVYATRKMGHHTQSRYLAPLSNLAACLAAAGTLPNAKEG